MAKKSKIYVVTAFQHNARVNPDFLGKNGSLDLYCKDRGAELIAVPMRGRNYRESSIPDVLEKMQENGQVNLLTHLTGNMDRAYKLNSGIRVADLAVLPQQIMPLTGLKRFAQGDASTILPAPKQQMQVIPSGNAKLPKVLMTTGAVTDPRYQGHQRIGRIAAKDHTYGAIVVEVVDGKKYHFRQLTALNNGTFVDLGVKYTTSGKEQVSPEALVLGDWHTGDTNKDVRDATFRMIKKYNPKTIILHDFWNGHSVNHHNSTKLATKAQEAKRGRLSLEQELFQGAQELYKFREVAGKDTEIVIVASNHDEFLDRYLQEGRFVNDPQNTEIASLLFNAMCLDKNPLQAGLELAANGLPEGITFLERDEDLRKWGWQLGAHGDKGANGSRGGSVKGMENAYGKVIYGHSHTPEKLRNAVRVGTSTDLRLDYTEGPSSWTNTHAFLWHLGGNEARSQLVNIIDGEWEMK
jgi:hypothetical protein